MEGMQRWLAVLVLFSGCAFGLSGPDPDRPRGRMPKCDTSKALVAVDGAMALTSGLIAVTLADTSEPAVALLPLSIGAIYLAGAVRGNSNVNKCRAAMSEFENYTAARYTMPEGGASAQREDEEELPQREVTPPPHTEMIKQPAPVASTAVATAPQPQQRVIPAPPAPVPAPAPAPAPTAKAPAAKSAAKPAPKQADDDWSDFWREVE
jgi:hypothetical protein